MKYKRILLKLSGEALMGDQNYGIDPLVLDNYANEISKIVHQHIQVAIVIGGGNIYRGLQDKPEGIERVQGDYMGMLATIINGIALKSSLTKLGLKVKLLSGIVADPVTESMSSSKAIEYLTNGNVVIISGGTGNPYFTTDTASALRAAEIKTDVLLKGTRVDGVYTADPEKDKNAKKYKHLTFDEAYNNKLKIMDLTAFTLCKENNIPVLVFNMNKNGNLLKIINGDKVGTLVTN